MMIGVTDASDDIQVGKRTSGIPKDVLMLGGLRGGNRLRRRQSRAYTIPLPPATTYGLRLHEPV